MLARRQQMKPARPYHRLRAAAGLELAKAAFDVGLHRAGGDDQPLRDLLVGQAKTSSSRPLSGPNSVGVATALPFHALTEAKVSNKRTIYGDLSAMCCIRLANAPPLSTKSRR